MQLGTAQTIMIVATRRNVPIRMSAVKGSVALLGHLHVRQKVAALGKVFAPILAVTGLAVMEFAALGINNVSPITYLRLQSVVLKIEIQEREIVAKKEQSGCMILLRMLTFVARKEMFKIISVLLPKNLLQNRNSGYPRTYQP